MWKYLAREKRQLSGLEFDSSKTLYSKQEGSSFWLTSSRFEDFESIDLVSLDFLDL